MRTGLLIQLVFTAVLLNICLCAGCNIHQELPGDETGNAEVAPGRRAFFFIVNNAEGLAAFEKLKQEGIAQGLQVAGREYYKEGYPALNSLITGIADNSSVEAIYVIINAHERDDAEKSLRQFKFRSEIKFIEVDPNGKYRLLLLRHDRKEKISNIISIYGDGSDLTNLGTCNFTIGHAGWSPSLQKIVFESNMNRYRLEENDIFIMDINGAGVKQLSNSSNGAGPNYRFPVWAPDGNSIAYCKSRTTSTGYTSPWRLAFRYDIFTMKSDGSDEKQAVSGTGEETQIAPAWFPDGRWLAYFSNKTGIYYLDAINTVTGESKIFDIKLRFPHDFEDNTSYSLSPDGTKIAYSQDTYSDINNRGRELYLYDINSRVTTRLTDNNYSDDFPCWSYDGSKIAFLTSKGIYIMNPDGSSPARIRYTTGADSPIYFGF